MSDNKNVDNPPGKGLLETIDSNIAVSASEVSSIAGSVKTTKTYPRGSSSSKRQSKIEQAQKCLENAALVTKQIKEHRKATAELLGRPFEDDDVGDTASEMASTMSERTGYSVATDTSTTLSVQEALNIPGISENLANTLIQKELLMERIKQYKAISKTPMKTTSTTRKVPVSENKQELVKKNTESDMSKLLKTMSDKDGTINTMEAKIREMNNTILDLKERINEKDEIIDAKNMATTLMSDSLVQKEKDSATVLEDTKQQMTEMQEKFIAMETEWKEEKQKLLKELELKDEKINNLEEANKILDNSRFEISVAHSKLAEELDYKNNQITELQNKIETLSQQIIQEPPSVEKDSEEEKGSREIAHMDELTKKIELLEQLNCQIRQTNKELESKLAIIAADTKQSLAGSPSKRGSPLPNRKGGRNTASKQKSPWSNLSSEPQETDKKANKSDAPKLDTVVQSLNKEILDKEYIISEKETIITELRNQISKNEAIIEDLQTNINKHEKEKAIDVVDIGVSVDLPVSQPELSNIEEKQVSTTQAELKVESDSPGIQELEEQLKAAQDQIAALNNEIDAANKNMIKVKSNHKLKVKQMQKTIDNFCKVSDSNAEIVKLNEELHQLSQKVAELEEEKGNLQLHLVDYDSGRLTESDVYKKLVESENLAETRLKAISVLEAQKFDLVQELHELQQKYMEMEDKLVDLSQLQNDQVCSEIKSVQLEEQIDQLTATRKEFELVIENLKLDKEQLNGSIKVLQEEKEELLHKLENYVQENMELTDKFEKLSAEKVSSAESIEIVESLTTQEKLELEEYNKGMIDNKSDGHSDTYKEPAVSESEKNVDHLVEQITELNSRIDLFTQERQEVMDKMNKLNSDNKTLQEKIDEMNNKCSSLQSNIDILRNEKYELQSLNEDLNRQIEELKHEKTQIMKETVEMVKPVVVEESLEGSVTDVQHDDKVADKGNNKTKSLKQLTKEILKLKNTIKDREAEIGDCQMKILSLEEQQQKQTELIQSVATYENKIKSVVDENNQLKEEINLMKKEKESEQNLSQVKQANELLQQDIQKLHQDYSAAINTRDSRVNELENVLLEYEKQIFNYGNTLQQKDKELTEYINQITKLNDVSQKLKSTIELLEEEKAKDQNAELIKSLNKQIAAYQKKMAEYEEKIRALEDEKSQLLTLKGTLENKNVNLESELKKLQESLLEKQTLVKELQTQQQKHAEDLSAVKLQAKERDEEIHEIKLQLRKESIENEKLRTNIAQKDEKSDEYSREFEEVKENVNKLTAEKEQLTEQITALETKNKELMDKLKKFALNFKKKSTMYTELENQYHEVQKQLEAKNEQLDQFLIQVDTLPALQEKLKHAEEELNRLQSQKIALEQQRSQDATHFQSQIKLFEEKVLTASEEISKLNDILNVSNKDLHFAREENTNLKAQIDTLNNKLSDYEVELKNNTNFVTKISSLEADIVQKQAYIAELSSKTDQLEQQLNQQVYGHNAKVQERDLYIEGLEAEINKYKNRICRLEESISAMEDRRHSLERKADQLDTQLREKQRAYSEYHSQEDELVSRLAVLMDHDRVVEKQLHEIENENKDLQQKVQYLNEENQRFRKSLSDIQEHCNTLVEKASKADSAESELLKYQTQLRDLETHFKRITHDHQALIAQKKHDIEELESEFNTQIENAIKEKKMLSEKYEKISDHLAQLEVKLQEYRANNENLTINIADLHKLNQDLLEKSATKDQIPPPPDYTEQYISEINKLNAIVNSKNQEMNELNNKIQALQVNNVAVVSNLEHKITEMTAELQAVTTDLDKLTNESHSLRQSNENLQQIVSQRDEQIKELMERKTVSFEMNIPKTEGMIISSTIEAVSEEPKPFDMSYLESQIVSADVGTHTDSGQTKIITEQVQKQAVKDLHSEGIIEPEIVPKKTYLCYKSEENVVEETDPFNSDEGWGFGEPDDTAEITPGLSHLNQQILQLQTDNQTLKSDLEASNTKLLKALKKLKELKSNNEILSKELKLSKQISQSSFLDTAIEDELRNNVQDLEKKIEEINADLIKERREKEAVKKQNEVFSNANDRLTEMKEKLDNEIELWKYKFKEANDKMSTLQWGSESKDTPDHKTVSSAKRDDLLENEMAKLEKENDELQAIVDQLTSQNKELSTQQKQLSEEVLKLNNEINTQHSKASCENCENLNHQLVELQNNNKEILSENEKLNEKIRDIEDRYNTVTQDYTKLKDTSEDITKELAAKTTELNEKCFKLEEEVQQLNLLNTELKIQVTDLITELDIAKEKLLWHEQQQESKKETSDNLDTLQLVEKFSAMEDYCSQLKIKLEESHTKIPHLESEKQELVQKLNSYELQITELNTKIQNLNAENDQLLSTVTELRSSISSAVDQRGFEIAELWKQHLAQREADFQKTEQELRTQLSASETKYEQLLDSVQSSSQEETNKLVMMEQLSSLQNKLQDKEEHLHTLQDKYAEVMNELHMLRSEIEDEKVMYENKLFGQQEDYEKQIEDLTLKNEEAIKDYEEKCNRLQSEITAANTDNSDLVQRIEELEKSIEDQESKIIDLSTQLRVKESEIYQKTHEYTITLAQRNEEFENVRKQLLVYEKKIEDLNFEKESELAVLRLKMHEKGEHFENTHKEIEAEKTTLAEALNQKIIECTNLNKQINDLNEILQEHSSRTTEMQMALENQEVEIVTLKDELNSLQNLMRSSSSKIEKHVTFASDTKPGTDGEKAEPVLNKELLDAVPRAELDLALYMLHQRDVRCEELTMELTQLLEERDTLQLRLSDSLRSNEELKSRYKDVGLDMSIDSSQETISELPTFAVEKEHQFVDTHRGQTSRSSSISDPDGEKPRLQAKLSELRSVKQNRDVRLRHESEQRQLDLRLLQRDVANLPPEAVDQLAQAHHTLSRDSQSTSTVLLNWLRGKSTPKVVHM